MLGEADPVLAETDRAPKYQYEKANWQQFQSRLNDQCSSVDPSDPCIDTYFENIRNMILKAADAAIPKRAPGARGVHQHSSKWWNEECAVATSAKRRALRTFQKNMTEDDRYTEGVQEKAEVLAGVFSRASQSRHLPEEVARYRAEEESRFETPVMDNSIPFNGDLTLKELKTAISGLGDRDRKEGQ